eukprot:2499134-Prymnesium_polylepis.1
MALGQPAHPVDVWWLAHDGGRRRATDAPPLATVRAWDVGGCSDDRHAPTGLAHWPRKIGVHERRDERVHVAPPAVKVVSMLVSGPEKLIDGRRDRPTAVVACG